MNNKNNWKNKKNNDQRRLPMGDEVSFAANNKKNNIG